jgi:hypothetical protein
MNRIVRQFDSLLLRLSRSQRKDIVVSCPRCERDVLAITYCDHILNDVCKRLSKYKHGVIPEHIRNPKYIIVFKDV